MISLINLALILSRRQLRGIIMTCNRVRTMYVPESGASLRKLFSTKSWMVLNLACMSAGVLLYGIAAVVASCIARN